MQRRHEKAHSVVSAKARGPMRVSAPLPSALPYSQAQVSRLLGNQRAKTLINRPVLQAKLPISQPGDPYELEADRIADRVMRMPDPMLSRAPTLLRVKSIQRRCGSCEDKEKLQRKAGDSHTRPPDSGINGVSATLGQSGRPLDYATRSFFESRMGYDLSAVQIHTGGAAAESAKAVNANAYTMGSDIVFGSQRYQPESVPGRHLLAHELAHVIQQKQLGRSIIQRQDDGGGRVFISGGVPDFLRCERSDLDADPDTSCCHPDSLAQVPGLYGESRSHTDRSLGRLTRGANMDGAITRHFGSAALSNRQAIIDSLRTIRAELDQESSHRILCRIALTSANGIGFDLMGRVDRRLFCQVGVNASAHVGGDIATLCVDRNGNPAGGWETLLHEVVHLSGVGNLPGTLASPAEIARGEVETYEGGVTYPNPAPFSLRNADSYSSFVRDVGAENWAEEPNLAALVPRLEAGAALSLESTPPPRVDGRHLLDAIWQRSADASRRASAMVAST